MFSTIIYVARLALYVLLMLEDADHIRERIKDALAMQRLEYPQLAKRLGVSRSSVAHWMSDRPIPEPMRIAIAHALGTTPDVLYGTAPMVAAWWIAGDESPAPDGGDEAPDGPTLSILQARVSALGTFLLEPYLEQYLNGDPIPAAALELARAFDKLPPADHPAAGTEPSRDSA